MGTIWLHPVIWASLWQTWYDLLIWFSLEHLDFTNHFFFSFSNVTFLVLSNVSGNVSIQIKIACKYFLIFSRQWRILLLYWFSLQSIWGLSNLSMSNCVHNVHTFLCAVNVVASGMAVWGQDCEEAWMGVWNISSTQFSFSKRLLPIPALLHSHLLLCACSQVLQTSCCAPALWSGFATSYFL